MAAAREIVEKSLLTEHSHGLEAKRTGIRVTMVLCACERGGGDGRAPLPVCLERHVPSPKSLSTVTLALFPNFGLIVNVVGGVSVSGLCFILPPLMLLQLRRYHLAAHERQVAYMRAAGVHHDAGEAPHPAAAPPPVLGFLDHVFNVHPLSPDAAPEDGAEVEEGPAGSAAAASSLRRSLWQYVSVLHAPWHTSNALASHSRLRLCVSSVQTHPFGARSTDAALRDSALGECVASHPPADPHSELIPPLHSHDLRVLLGSVAIGPLGFHPRFATVHGADHVRAVDIDPGGERTGRLPPGTCGDVVFSQPHKGQDDGPRLLLSRDQREPALLGGGVDARVTLHRAAPPPSIGHVLRESEEEAVRALLAALRHVHWPRLPTWFPLHAPAAAESPAREPAAAEPGMQQQQQPVTGGAAPGDSIVLHGHRLPAHLAALHSSYDVLSEAALAEEGEMNRPLPTHPPPPPPTAQHAHRSPATRTRAGRRASIITHVAQRRRHMVALQLLGVGSPAETAFLVAVVAFGAAALLMTTTQSLLQATGAAGPDDQSAVCRA